MTCKNIAYHRDLQKNFSRIPTPLKTQEEDTHETDSLDWSELNRFFCVKMNLPLKKRYMHRSRSEWENVDEFKGWLKPASGNSTKAFCTYCSMEIVAKLFDIKKHAQTKKHTHKVELKSATFCEIPSYKPLVAVGNTAKWTPSSFSVKQNTHETASHFDTGQDCIQRNLHP
ncbi:hypothetical protein ACJJTC_008632 [Scirpophaga incertulas]